jgi:hypothetical protein
MRRAALQLPVGSFAIEAVLVSHLPNGSRTIVDALERSLTVVPPPSAADAKARRLDAAGPAGAYDGSMAAGHVEHGNPSACDHTLQSLQEHTMRRARGTPATRAISRRSCPVCV